MWVYFTNSARFGKTFWIYWAILAVCFGQSLDRVSPGVKFTVCPDESRQAKRRDMNLQLGSAAQQGPTPRNIGPGWFHTHINLWGPSGLPGGVVHFSIPSPVLWRLGLPFSTSVGPFERGGPRLYVSAYLLDDDFKRKRSRFVRTGSITWSLLAFN